MDTNYIIINGQLYHHGVKGMKWGVRRFRQKARAAYSASSRTFGEKRRQKAMEKARTYDEIADKIERGDKQIIADIRKQNLKRAAKIGATVAAGCLAAYGGYKLNEFINSASYTVNGKSVSRQEFSAAVKMVVKSLS